MRDIYVVIIFMALATGTVAGLMHDSGWFHGWYWNLVAAGAGIAAGFPFAHWLDQRDTRSKAG